MRSIYEFNRFRQNNSDFQRVIRERADALRGRTGLAMAHRPSDLKEVRRRYNRVVDRVFTVDYHLNINEERLEFFLKHVTSDLFSVLVRHLKSEDAIMESPLPQMDEIKSELVREHWDTYFAADVCSSIFAELHAANFTVTRLMAHSVGQRAALLRLCQETDAENSDPHGLFWRFLEDVFSRPVAHEPD